MVSKHARPTSWVFPFARSYLWFDFTNRSQFDLIDRKEIENLIVCIENVGQIPRYAFLRFSFSRVFVDRSLIDHASAHQYLTSSCWFTFFFVFCLKQSLNHKNRQITSIDMTNENNIQMFSTIIFQLFITRNTYLFVFVFCLMIKQINRKKIGSFFFSYEIRHHHRHQLMRLLLLS